MLLATTVTEGDLLLTIIANLLTVIASLLTVIANLLTVIANEVKQSKRCISFTF